MFLHSGACKGGGIRQVLDGRHLTDGDRIVSRCCDQIHEMLCIDTFTATRESHFRTATTHVFTAVLRHTLAHTGIRETMRYILDTHSASD